MNNNNNNSTLKEIHLEGKIDANPELMAVIDDYERELEHLKRKKIQQLVPIVYQKARGEIFRAAIPSLILVILSFFVGVTNVPFVGNIFETISLYVNPDFKITESATNSVPLWWFPPLIYLIFVVIAILTNKKLKDEFEKEHVSEASITRILDRYSGMVDGLGTALPLLGAAILLISISKGPALFLGFAVPFEIKSIIILAIAKLFDSVFDALALKYQEMQEILHNLERAYTYTYQTNHSIGSAIPSTVVIESTVTKEEVERIYETMKASQELGYSIKGLLSELNNLRLPDEKILKEMQVTSASLGQTIKFLGDTLNSFKDSNVSKSLENMVTLVGKK